jgi:hypothetical protein
MRFSNFLKSSLALFSFVLACDPVILTPGYLDRAGPLPAVAKIDYTAPVAAQSTFLSLPGEAYSIGVN